MNLKNVFPTYSILLVAICLFGVASTSELLNAQSASERSFSSTRFKQLKLPHNRTVTIGQWGTPSVEVAGKKQPLSSTGSVSKFYAVFPDPADEKMFFAIGQVSQSNNGMELLRYNAATGETWSLIRTHERLRPSQVSFQQTANGNIFVISNQGLLLCFRDGKHVDRLALDGFYQDAKKMFKPIEGVVADENRVMFFSRVAPDDEGKALRDLIVYENGEFKTLDLGGKSLGSVQTARDNQLNFLTFEGLQIVDIATGQISEKAIQGPEVGGVSLVPVSLFFRSNGEMISVWRKPKINSSFQAFDDGFITRIAEIESGAWVLKPIGLESSSRKWATRFGEDAMGRLWISGTRNGRLVVRHPDGTYQAVETMRQLDEFDVAEIGFEGTDKIVFHSTGSNKSLKLSIAELLTRKPGAFSNWHPIQTQTPLIPDTKQSIYGITRDQGGRLFKFTNGEFEFFDLPKREEMETATSTYLTTDTDDNVWLFSDRQNKAAMFAGQVWTVFGPENRDGEEWSAKQVALATRAKTLSSDSGLDTKSEYRLGLVGSFQVQFGPDQQILFTNSKSRIEYFDGTRWHSPTSGREISRFIPLGLPFFEDGAIRFFDALSNCYSMKPEQFKALKQANATRPWKEIDPKSSKNFESWQRKKLARRSRPTGNPPSGARPNLTGNTWLALRANQVSIALPGQAWSTISLKGTPLENTQRLKVYDTPGDAIIFVSRDEHFIYTPPPAEIIVEEVSLGEFDQPGRRVVPKFATNPPNQKVHFRYRIADDPWSTWKRQGSKVLIRGVAKQGKHKIQFEFNFDDHLAKAKKIDFEFTTNYSLQEKIDEQITLLSSTSFADRESAMKKLIEIGPAVVPSAEAMLNSQDAETRVRGKKIINAIKSRMSPIKP